jgi:hypothetical protein
VEKFDLRAQLVAHLRSGKHAYKPNGSQGQFRCPRHDDKTPSAWIGDHRWGCFACGFEESLGTLAAILGVEDKSRRGFTLEDYAERKGFTVSNLERWGLRTATGKYGDDVLVIPYRDADGNELRTKIRTASKSFWGTGEKTHLYGLDVLAKAIKSKPVILCEGESDCHAAWHHGVLAIGVPGASGWRSDWSALFDGRDVFVWKEPDEAGSKLVAAVARDIPSARVIDAKDVKDLADLHKVQGKGFKSALSVMMAASYPSSHKPPKIHFAALTGPKLDAILVEKLKPVDAVPTPLPSWNSACRDAGGGVGLARGWHITIGANTGSGKSLIALNLAARAVKAGERVCFISLEMSDVQLATRYLSILSGESVRHLESGSSFNPDTYKRAARYADAVREESGGMMFVNELPIYQLTDVADAIKYNAEVHGCRYVVTDYLQLAEVTGVRDRVEAITIVSHTVRNTSRDAGVVSIGLSQFNRETSKDYENPPTPQGLMGGSPLENDSDQVALLDHSTYSRDPISDAATTRLLLAKNRHGPLKQIDVTWHYSALRIAEQSFITLPLPEGKGEAWEPESAVA